MASIEAASAAGVEAGLARARQLLQRRRARGIDAERRDLAGQGHRLGAGLRRRRHAAEREVHRDPIDAEVPGQLPHRVAHAKGGVARAQHRRAETQHDVEGFGQSGWLFRRPRR